MKLLNKITEKENFTSHFFEENDYGDYLTDLFTSYGCSFPICHSGSHFNNSLESGNTIWRTIFNEFELKIHNENN